MLYAEFGRAGRRQDRVAWAETYNLPTRDLELAACFMGATANGSVSGTRTPVYFFSVSFDIDDPVDESMIGRVAQRTLRDMGLEEHEAVVVAHRPPREGERVGQTLDTHPKVQKTTKPPSAESAAGALLRAVGLGQFERPTSRLSDWRSSDAQR